MKVLDFITFKELNEMKKQDAKNKLNVRFNKEGSLEEVTVFSWIDCMGNKGYALQAYKFGFGSYWSNDYDTLEEVLNLAAEIIKTNFTTIEKSFCSRSYINDSRKNSLALEIFY